MSAWGAMGPGTRVLIVVLGGTAAVGVGYLGWQATQRAEPASVVAVVPEDLAPASAPETEAQPVASAPELVPEAEPHPAPVAVAAPDVPKIDTWRVAPDGEALVAGMALPGATVEVIVDDRPVAEGKALPSGEFVLQFTLAPNSAPSLLWLSMTPPGGTPVASPEMVALAPIAGPAPVAAEPEPAAVEVAAAEPAPEPPAVPVEPAAPTALLVTKDGAVVLQDAAPADPVYAAQVMIDTIAYSPAGEVQIGGRGAAGSGLRLYLDNAEAAEATVPEDGRWLVTLGDTLPGIYMLRVDQFDTAGKVTSRFETPFKRETLDDLAMTAESETGTPPVDPAPTVAEAIPAPAVEPMTEAPAAPAEPQASEPVAAAVEAAPASDPAVEAAEKLVDDAAATDSDTASAEPLVISEPGPEPAAITITVQPGFTLWGIAQERMGDGVMYVQVFEANRDKIKNPDLIYPGQVFSIPAATP